MELTTGKTMADDELNGALKSVRKLIDVHALRAVSDGDLLHRFADSGDEAAFRVIAERHGPMVFGVCRRALHCVHDAEDAFQATFLVFSQHAQSIRNTDALGSWLHGVAKRVTMKLLREQRRRKNNELAKPPTEARSVSEELTWAEIKTGLDEELGQLPTAYREVLVLCYLEGQTRDEAARRLDVPLGAVKGRLERARKMLAGRLAKRGLTLSAGLLAVAVSPATLTATVRAACLLAIGQSAAHVASPAVATLTEAILKGMAMRKSKLLGVGLVCSVILAMGVGMGVAQTPGGNDPLISPQQRPQATRQTPLNSARHTALTAIQAPLETPASPRSYVGGRPTVRGTTLRGTKTAELNDEQFIRRLSLDLRNVEPTPAEVHFFVKSKIANKRKVLVELFLGEVNQAKKKKKTNVERMRNYQLALDYYQAALNREKERAKTPRQQKTTVRELKLLRIRVDQAQLAVKHKQLLLAAAKEDASLVPAGRKRVESQRNISLLKIELQSAELELRQAEIMLEDAQDRRPVTSTPARPRK